MESRLSTTSSVNEFINLRVETVEDDIRSYTKLKQDIFESFCAKQITEIQHQDGLQDLQNKLVECKNEESVLKKQRKILEEDIASELPLYSDIDKAYKNILVSKVMAATSKQSKQQHQFDKSTFRRKVKRFYGTSRQTPTGIVQSFCAVFGWVPKDTAVAAHLVPKSLNSGELEYLFGVNDNAMLSDPRVAIPLHIALETALDLGKIVIVPINAEKTGAELKWMCLVTDKKELPLDLCGEGTKWSDVHKKELKWSNKNRPAKRYLYFRFVMTYLMCKMKNKPTDWADEIAAKGKMWCTPGPYLRRSMLKLLSIECGDFYLPEIFYKEQTFDELGQDGEKEKSMAKDMRDRLALLPRKKRVQMENDEYSDDSVSEDSDSEGEDSEDAN